MHLEINRCINSLGCWVVTLLSFSDLECLSVEPSAEWKMQYRAVTDCKVLVVSQEDLLNKLPTFAVAALRRSAVAKQSLFHLRICALTSVLVSMD